MNTDIVTLTIERTTKKSGLITISKKFPIWEFTAYKGGEVQFIQMIVERMQRSLDFKQKETGNGEDAK